MSDGASMTEPTPPKLRRRWLLPTLLVSLALNLAVAGIVVGWALSPQARHHRDSGPARGVIGEPFIRALPEDARRALMHDVIEEREHIRDSRDGLRARFDAFLSALRADPYDPEVVRDLLAEQRGAAQGRQEIGETLLLKRLAAMEPQDRAAYADRLETLVGRLKWR